MLRVPPEFREFLRSLTSHRPEFLLEPGKVVRMGLAPNRSEVLTGIAGVDFDACQSRRAEAVIDGFAVPVISLPDLKVHKKASGRHKDLNDLEQLP